MMHKAWRSTEEMPYCFRGHPYNFKVTQAEKLTIWIQFEITRPVAAIKFLRFALFIQILTLLSTNFCLRVTSVWWD